MAPVTLHTPSSVPIDNNSTYSNNEHLTVQPVNLHCSPAFTHGQSCSKGWFYRQDKEKMLSNRKHKDISGRNLLKIEIRVICAFHFLFLMLED